MSWGRTLVLLFAALVARPGRAVATFQLESAAFKAGETIPRRNTCDGEDLSPQLAWTGAPPGTKGFALICDDPDAPVGTWVHWVLYDVPARLTSLPESVPAVATLADGSRQGVNDFRRPGYGGPCPPHGAAHRYFFRLYALDVAPELPPGATKPALLKAIEGHTLGVAELMGRYARQ